MTHDELVERAVRWLKNSAVYPAVRKDFDLETDDEGNFVYVEKGRQIVNTRVRCPLVLSEIHTSTSETPDAIGFFQGGSCSILIECKTSVSDFYSDRSKPFRKQPELGMGNFRWYMTPKGLVTEKMKEGVDADGHSRSEPQ